MTRETHNPYFNAYNHSNKANISRIEDSPLKDYSGNVHSVLRVGHIRRSKAHMDRETETSSIEKEFLSCMFVCDR